MAPKEPAHTTEDDLHTFRKTPQPLCAARIQALTVRSILAKMPETSNAIDVAARYLVYKLYDVTGGHPNRLLPVAETGEAKEVILKAVERGWVVI